MGRRNILGGDGGWDCWEEAVAVAVQQRAANALLLLATTLVLTAALYNLNLFFTLFFTVYSGK